MLLSFRVANVLSIREEQVLSFVATDLNEGIRPHTGAQRGSASERPQERSDRLLPSVL